MKVPETTRDLKGFGLEGVFFLGHLGLEFVEDPGLIERYRIRCCYLNLFGFVQDLVEQALKLLLEGTELDHLLLLVLCAHLC